MNINHVDNYATASWHWLVLNAERKKEKEVEECVMTTYRRKCRGLQISTFQCWILKEKRGNEGMTLMSEGKCACETVVAVYLGKLVILVSLFPAGNC